MFYLCLQLDVKITQMQLIIALINKDNKLSNIFKKHKSSCCLSKTFKSSKTQTDNSVDQLNFRINIFTEIVEKKYHTKMILLL